MPIFEYRCNKCGATSEFLTDFGKDEGISCKTCGNDELERIPSVVSFLGNDTQRERGHTCCGQEERCEKPPCSVGGGCRRG